MWMINIPIINNTFFMHPNLQDIEIVYVFLCYYIDLFFFVFYIFYIYIEDLQNQRICFR